MATKKCPKEKEISKVSGNCVKKCKPGQYRSEKTGRCRKKSTNNKRRTKLPTEAYKCPEGKEVSPVSGKCVKKCKANQRRNRSTGRCRKIKSKPDVDSSSIPYGKYITKSGDIETRVNTGRSVEFESTKDMCQKTNKKICKLAQKYNLLPEDYFIAKKLGEGVNGKTYLLCNRNTKKCDRVIKHSKKVTLEDFENEAKMNKYFYKAGIAPRYLGGTYLSREKEFVIIMGRIDTTLEDYLAQKLTQKEIKKVFTKIEAVLEKMRKNDLLHGDFHLGNIGLVQKKNSIEPLLIDFGYSKKIPGLGGLSELDYIQLYRTIRFNKSFKGKKIHSSNFDYVKNLAKKIYINRFGKQHFSQYIDKKSFNTIDKRFKEFYKTDQYLYSDEAPSGIPEQLYSIYNMIFGQK